MNIKDNRREFLLVISIVAFLIVILISTTVGHIIVWNYNFSGKVEKIEYPDSLKHIPTITVNNKQYDLLYCHYNIQPDLGDSVVKKKGEMDLLIIKK